MSSAPPEPNALPEFTQGSAFDFGGIGRMPVSELERSGNERALLSFAVYVLALRKSSATPNCGADAACSCTDFSCSAVKRIWKGRE